MIALLEQHRVIECGRGYAAASKTRGPRHYSTTLLAAMMTQLLEITSTWVLETLQLLTERSYRGPGREPHRL